MYPFLRMAKELWKFRNAPRLSLGQSHVSQHICWPWDLDIWRELNNGRTLTLYDLGRIPLAHRLGLIQALRQNHWGMAVAGVSVRYRKRVRGFERVEMRSRALGWDARFLYLEQGLWNRAGECAGHALYRMAVTGPGGIVAPARVAAAIGLDPVSPELPKWVCEWIRAEDHRPWPPQL